MGSEGSSCVRAAGERRTDAAWKIGKTALTIGLAVGSAFFSGGTSLALLGATAALGVHGAADTTADYLRDRAAANTDLDPNDGLGDGGLDRRRS